MDSRETAIKLDPDQLVLTKQDVLAMLDAIKQRWMKNKIANAKFLASVEAMRIGILLTGEDTIKEIWSEIVKGFNELLYRNALARARGENPSFAETFSRIKSDVKDGKVF